MRAVETAPTAMPIDFATSPIVVTALPFDAAQSRQTASLLMPSMLLFDLTPVVIATAEGAESVTRLSCA